MSDKSSNSVPTVRSVERVVGHFNFCIFPFCNSWGHTPGTCWSRQLLILGIHVVRVLAKMAHMCTVYSTVRGRTLYGGLIFLIGTGEWRRFMQNKNPKQINESFLKILVVFIAVKLCGTLWGGGGVLYVID